MPSDNDKNAFKMPLKVIKCLQNATKSYKNAFKMPL